MSTHALDFLSSNNLKGNEKYRWGRVFASPLPVVVDAFAPYAEKAGCIQEVALQRIFWVDENRHLVAMFCLVPEPSDLDSVCEIFAEVAERSPRVTFVIVHQKADGTGNYDIFRLSPASYLEHHNRVFHRGE